jgi:DNA-binding transcriptional LysR family regulator
MGSSDIIDHAIESDKPLFLARTNESDSAMPVDLQDLDAFAAVARHRSFRKAAAERGVSASALSHAIRGLEERIGVRLLNRTTRSVTPTEAGFEVLARLEPAIRDVAAAIEEVSRYQQTPAGRLRLNVPRPAARLVFAPMLAKFLAAYPRIKIEIVADDSLKDVVGEGFDAGVRFGEKLARDMIAVRIGAPQRFVAVASPDYLSSHGAPATPRDLTRHACICRRFPSGGLYAWEFEKAGETIAVDVDGPIVTDDDEVMAVAAIDGAGVAYVYENHVREAIKSGSLVSILSDWTEERQGFYLYYPSTRQMPSPLRALIDYLKDAPRPTG